ncbi:cellulase family glycosylhydrolase [Ruminococcus sp.]|uniref:glycoside hydrolase family 5 protein n=1 Tax=Ruminococcus sp. TaxID=41978 RepID=UPI0025FBA9BE|nr:cellulase family glycosylhydrolase [Ruminococcus sp.]MBQ8966603.1 cellulase family glycosylhydrolase [Ruminococcus sp.]
MKFSGRSLGRTAALLLAVSVLATIGAAAEGTGNEAVTKVTKKDVSKYTAAQISADMGLGLKAGESFDAVQAAAAKNGGFSTVKVSGSWDGLISDDGSFTLDADWLAGLKAKVDAAASQDMYIILELTGGDYAKGEQKAVWSRVAEEFADYDRKLIFAGDFIEVKPAADKAEDKKDDTADKKTIPQTIRSVKGSENRVLLADAGDWYTLSGEGNIIAGVDAAGFAVKGDAFTDEDAAMIENSFGKIELDWVNAGVPVIIDNAAFSGFAMAEENVKWAESFAEGAKKLGVAAVFDKVGGKEDKAADKLLKTYADTNTTGSVFTLTDTELECEVADTGYIELNGGKGSIALDDLFSEVKRDKVKAVRLTCSSGFSVEGEKGSDVVRKVIDIAELTGDSLSLTNSAGGYAKVKYEIFVGEDKLEAYTKYLQFTEPDGSGQVYARAVMMVKYEDIADVSSVKFTFDLDGKEASVNSSKFYHAVSQQGELTEPDEDYVFVAAVISGVPEESVEGFTIKDIELVRTQTEDEQG